MKIKEVHTASGFLKNPKAPKVDHSVGSPDKMASMTVEAKTIRYITHGVFNDTPNV